MRSGLAAALVIGVALIGDGCSGGAAPASPDGMAPLGQPDGATDGAPDASDPAEASDDIATPGQPDGSTDVLGQADGAAPADGTCERTGEPGKDMYVLALPAGHVVDLISRCVPNLDRPEWYIGKEPSSVVDSSVVEQSADGRKVLGIAPGHAVLRLVAASQGTVHLVIDVTVTASDVTKSEIVQSSSTPVLYAAVDVQLVNHYADGTMADVTEWSAWKDVPGRVGVIDDRTQKGALTRRWLVPVMVGPAVVPFTLAGESRQVNLTVGTAANTAAPTIAVNVPSFVARVGTPALSRIGLTFSYATGRGGFTTVVPWTSSAPAVVAPATDSTATCLARGAAEAKFILPDRQLTASVNCVSDEDAISIAIHPSETLIKHVSEGPTFFSAQATFPPAFVDSITPTWTSSDPTVASFGTEDNANALTPHKKGSTTVTATFAQRTATVRVDVLEP